MTKSLHLALLVCDTPMVEVVQQSGDYKVMFTLVFGLAAKNLNITLTWDYFDVVEAQEYPSFEDIGYRKYDAILMTGSKHNAHDNEPWILKMVEFVQKVQREYTYSVKLVGICFGHQIICRAAGGKTGRNEKGWEIGYTELQLTSFGKKFFETDRDFLKINQSHQDHVSIIPEGFQCLAYTDNTPHQALVSDDRQCITIQGHPEFSKDTSRIMIEKRKDQGIFPPELSKRALDALNIKGLNMDDVWLSERFLEFVIS